MPSGTETRTGEARDTTVAGATTSAAAPPHLDRTTEAGPDADDIDATTAPRPTEPRAETSRAAPDPGAGEGDAPVLARGSLIGRYVVLDRLGAGAMGVVYAAFDPELDRKVALKLLQPGLGGGSLSATADARARLVREAQALARLNHPNVVGIFDVGTHDEQVWIAMEFVEGRTLRNWLAPRRTGWREVLEVMRSVARGLSAAHAAGLVHRDVKPDNVMVGDDGRVRVMDFGLARRGAASPGGATETAAAPTQALLAAEVTHAGTMIGTPAYMAPEQFRGDAVGPPADIFAFCVMMWEALHGARPFAGETIAALRANVEAGRLSSFRGRTDVPRWLDAALLRGLAAAPGQRWPSFDALLAALERGQSRTRRRRVLAVIGGLLTLTAGIAGGRALAHERALDACAAAGATIASDWSADARDGLARAFAATGKANAATVFERTAPWLDRWAAGWQAARAQVCVAHDIGGALDDELHARALDCLDERRGSFAALLHELGEPDALTLARATPAAAGLTTSADCTDPAALRERSPLSSERRAEVTEIRGLIARASSMNLAGKYKQGLALAQEAAAAATAAAWPPVIAEAEYRVGHLESQTGDFASAEKSLLRALAAAREARAPRPALVALTHLVFVVGDRSARYAEGKVWAEAARTELMHVVGDARHLEAQLDNNLALVFHAQGAYAEAIPLHERALAAWTATYGAEHPQVAQSLNNLANAHNSRGDRDAALGLHERALAIRGRTLGPDHPLVAASLSNIANIELNQGRIEDARRLYERALAIRERALDPSHPDVIESLNNLANVHYSSGALGEALPLYQRALAAIDATPGGNPRLAATILYNCGLIREDQCQDAEAVRDHSRALEQFESFLGPDHPTLGYPLAGLGASRINLGELDEAQRLFTRSLTIREAALGKDHPELLFSVLGLAEVARRRGDLDAALRLCDRGLELGEAAYGKDHPLLAAVLSTRGEILVSTRRPTEAIAALERAVAVVPPEDRSPRAAKLRFLLARVRWDARDDRPRARALAERAAADLEKYRTCAREQEQLRAWLAAHPR